MVPSLEALTDTNLIFPHLEAGDAAGVLRELATRIAVGARVSDADELYARLHEREQLGSTAIGRGVAIPHCKLDALPRALIAIGLSPTGVDFHAGDGQPVRIFFVVVSPTRSPAEHLQCLAMISRWARVDEHLHKLLEQHDAESVAALLREPA